MVRIWKFVAIMFAMAFFGAGTANAQATRTWVSGVGDDVNPCSRTAPCKTFAGAISKTAAGGEINCLDPGGFGTVTVTKSMTFDCTGTLGSVLASSTTGFIVNGAGVHVVIRGITINGGTPTAPGLHGVRFLQGSSVTIEDCIIQNFRSTSAGTGNGVTFAPSTVARLVINNTVIINNGGAGNGGGVLVQPTGAGGSAQVLMNNVLITGNTIFGVSLNTNGTTGAGIIATLNNVRAASSQNGLEIRTAVGTPSAQAIVSDSVFVNNTTTGILATGPTSSARVSNNVISSNAQGINPTAGGFIRSVGGNLLDANSVNGSFSDTIPKV